MSADSKLLLTATALEVWGKGWGASGVVRRLRDGGIVFLELQYDAVRRGLASPLPLPPGVGAAALRADQLLSQQLGEDVLRAHADPRGILVLEEGFEPAARDYEGVVDEAGLEGLWVRLRH